MMARWRKLKNIMSEKIILVTGATDGLGLASAQMLCAQGARVVLHGRNQEKLDSAHALLKGLCGAHIEDGYVADFSSLSEVRSLAQAIKEKYKHLSVIINNAGVYQLQKPLNFEGLDLRFVVNTIAPYFLTRSLLPLLGEGSRVINISSAAQSPLEWEAFLGHIQLRADLAYAQSKLALIMWTNAMAAQHEKKKVQASFIALNPKSFLNTSMVHHAYGIEGADINIGAKAVCRAALSSDFEQANGLYFDNDIGSFALAHPDSRNTQLCDKLIETMDRIISPYLS